MTQGSLRLQIQGKVVHRAINACITPLCAMDGHHVLTVEGIGSVKKGLHPVQQELADRWRVFAVAG